MRQSSRARDQIRTVPPRSCNRRMELLHVHSQCNCVPCCTDLTSTGVVGICSRRLVALCFFARRSLSTRGTSRNSELKNSTLGHPVDSSRLTFLSLCLQLSSEQELFVDCSSCLNVTFPAQVVARVCEPSVRTERSLSLRGSSGHS